MERHRVEKNKLIEVTVSLEVSIKISKDYESSDNNHQFREDFS